MNTINGKPIGDMVSHGAGAASSLSDTGRYTVDMTFDALEALCTCLQERGGHIWPHYPLDAEAMYRLREHS